MPRKVFLFPSPTLCPASSTDGALLFYAFSPPPPPPFPFLPFFPSRRSSPPAHPVQFVSLPSVFPPTPMSRVPLSGSSREETLIITWQLLSRGKSLVWVP